MRLKGTHFIGLHDKNLLSSGKHAFLFCSQQGPITWECQDLAIFYVYYSYWTSKYILMKETLSVSWSIFWFLAMLYYVNYIFSYRGVTHARVLLLCGKWIWWLGFERNCFHKIKVLPLCCINLYKRYHIKSTTTMTNAA